MKITKTGLDEIAWNCSLGVVRQSCLCVNSSEAADISLLTVMQPHIYIDAV